MISDFENFKNIINKALPEIPKHITEEWILNALQNDYFSIWGFTFSDLSNHTFGKISEATLRRVSFSTYTKFPKEHPFNIDFYSLVDRDIKDLHKEDITGKGVNVAIIDQGISLVHDELKDCLKDYKNYSNKNSFHGLTVASSLAGKNLGVAPQANIFSMVQNRV